MTGKKSAYLCSVLCSILVASSFLISDVNARSYRGSSHGSHGSHHTSHTSHTVHKPTHTYPTHTHPVAKPPVHNYPSHPTHSPGGHGVSTGHGSYPPSNGMSGNSGSGTLHPISRPTVHSYPPSNTNAMSGSGSQTGSGSYPPSNGMSGNSGSGTLHPISRPTVHSYPPSNTNTMSGSGSQTGSGSYPPSNGMSGNSGSGTLHPISRPTVHSYSPSNTNTMFGSGSQTGPGSYPPSNGMSGNTGIGTHYPISRPTVHTYPPSNPNTMSGSGSRPGHGLYPPSYGISGNTGSGSHYPTGGSSYPVTNTHHSTSWGSQREVHHVHTGGHTVVHHHHHYDYRPPTVIHFQSSYGPVSYPVYTGVPPPYVYEYRSSGNKYSHLLAGLALYNLGRMSASSRSHDYHRHYIPQPDEYCKFGVRYQNGVTEEMAIDCRAITYFIFESQPQAQTYVTANTVNQTTITTQTMYANGTLAVPANSQVSSGNGVFGPNPQVLADYGAVISNTQQVLAGNGAVMPNTQQVNTAVTTTTQTVSVTDPRFFGSPVDIKPDMECYVIRHTGYSNMKKPVPCALLQKYSSSLHRSSAAMIKSSLTVIIIAAAYLLY